MANSNNPPDVILELTHEQASFLLESCKANVHLAMNLIISIQHDDCSLEEKRKKAEKYLKPQDQFREIMKKLRAAGAKEDD